MLDALDERYPTPAPRSSTRTGHTRWCCARPCRQAPLRAAYYRRLLVFRPRRRCGPCGRLQSRIFARGFLAQGFPQPPFILAGSLNDAGFRAVEELYRGVNAPLLRTSISVRKSVKWLSNTYHAVKIACANEAGVLLSRLRQRVYDSTI